MKEIWEPIKGYEGLYEVSSLGRVKSLKRKVENNGGLQMRRETILRASGKTHLGVTLCKNGKTKRLSVHRLVAEAFVPNPEGKPVVDHIDTNPKNNSVDNLRWVTTQENCMNPLTRINNSKSKMGHKCYLKQHSEETKQKLRELNTGKKRSDETRRKLSEAHKGHTLSAKTRRKLSKVRMGHDVSDETRQKIREKLTGVHKEKHWKVVDGKRVWY